MPNRIIKESICTSESLSELTDFEFRLWVGLITQADDAGRGDARPAIIKGHVFPLRDRVTVKDIDAALHGLAAKGCVSLYMVGGKPYFWFPTWAEHQRIRDYKPRFPGPDEADDPNMTICGELPQVAADGGQRRPTAADGGLNTIQYNPNPNTNPNTNNRRSAPFAPPSVDDVRAYCTQRGNGIDPEAFVAFYAARGWKLSGNVQMKDWKQAVITWEKRRESGDVRTGASSNSGGSSAKNVPAGWKPKSALDDAD